MNVEEQAIQVRVNNFTLEHFLELGYNVHNGSILTIRAKELPSGSGLKVDVECSYCGKIFKKSWRRYLETKNNVCCKECKTSKMIDVSLKKYGNVCSLCNPEIAEKRRKTNIEKYGVEFPFQSQEIREKCFETMESDNKHPFINTSKTQVYLCGLYNGELNKRFGNFFVDIFLNDKQIAIEYDGSGHWYSVKRGEMSLEDYERKEREREKVLIDKGLKIIRIKYLDLKDSLLSDNEMIEILNDAIKEFESGNNIYRIDLKTKIKSVEK